MPSSRLYEMLAEAGARPSGAFQDATAGITAANQVATSAYDYQKNKRLDTKLSQLLNDPSYGDMTLRDVSNKDSGLLELLKLKAENADVPLVAPTYDESGQPTGQANLGKVSKKSKIIQPSSITVTREGLEHRRNQDTINNFQEELKSVRAAKDKVSILGTPVNQNQYDALSAREDYLTGQLSSLGVRVNPPVKPIAPVASPPAGSAVTTPAARPAQKVRLTDGKTIYEVDADKAQEKMTKYGLKPAP